MKNKGFTLIELLGIVVLLIIMSAFAFPALNKLLKDRPQMEYETFQKIVTNAAESYVGSHYDELDFQRKVSIPIQFLIAEGYLKDSMVNPDTNRSIPEEDGYVNVTKGADNLLSYTYVVHTINEPVLSDNMIPVYYDEECNNKAGCWRKADRTNATVKTQWYDYVNGKWANAVTVRVTADTNVLNSKSRQEYLDAAIGTIIADEDILTFFVWIPRYEYKLNSLNNYAGGTKANPGAIDIQFVDNTNSASSADYKINNAFTFGNQELKGIWVGKFSSSAGNTSATTPQTIYIKPNVINWHTATIATYFTSTRNMELANNIYGFSQNASATTVTTTGSGTYGDIPNDANQIDTHVMKGSEWGAVAYLSQSLYGRCITSTNCPEIVKNNSTAYYTGRSSGGDTATSTEGSYVYNTKEGMMSSTTYNVYGVYDMVNSLWNILMGNVNTNINNPTAMTLPSQSGFSTTSYPNNKYINYYYSRSVSCGNNGNCYGHAFEETSGWYNDYIDFTNDKTNLTWLIRGNSILENWDAGLFLAGSSVGVNHCFHTVLVNF